jgi:hypothetical protein
VSGKALDIRVKIAICEHAARLVGGYPNGSTVRVRYSGGAKRFELTIRNITNALFFRLVATRW